MRPTSNDSCGVHHTGVGDTNAAENAERAVARFTPRIWSAIPSDCLRIALERKRIRRVTIVAGTVSAKAIDLQRVIASSLAGFAVDVVDGIEPASPTGAVVRCRERIRAFDCEVVVAVGGGSIIDTAKAAAALATLAGCLTEADVVRMWSAYPIRLPRRSVDLIVIPTTAGTGTEATPFAVLSAPDNTKLVGISPELQPDMAILVPDFLGSVPRRFIADLAVDAISHALEAFWSRRASAESDCLAVTALSLLYRNLEAYHNEPRNRDAGSAVQMAATLAGDAFRLASSTACHALSFPLAWRCRLSHGRACSVLLPAVTRLNVSSTAVQEKVTSLGAVLGFARPEDLPSFLEGWLGRVGAAHRGPSGLSGSDVAAIAATAVPHMLENNPVPVNFRCAEGLVRAAVAN